MMHGDEVADATSPVRGRADAIRALTALLADAAAGRGRAILIEGVAGVGKTTLIDRTVRAAASSGFDVRRTAADQNESGLPFAALAALFGPELRDETLATTTPALAAAFGRTISPQPPMIAAVAADAIQALSSRSNEQPMLLVLDDAQWADPSSVAVLVNVATHLVTERVGVVIARRTDGPDDAGIGEDRRADRILAGLPPLRLEPLTHDDATALLVAAGFEPASADRWALVSGGLPLALAEIARGGPRQPTERRAVEKLLPELFRAQLAELSAPVAEGTHRRSGVVVRTGGGMSVMHRGLVGQAEPLVNDCELGMCGALMRRARAGEHGRA